MTIQESLKFEQNLYNLINTCGLPVDTAYYILKSVYYDFQKTIYEYAEKKQGGYVTEEQILKVDGSTKPVNLEVNIDNTGEKGEQKNAE